MKSFLIELLFYVSCLILIAILNWLISWPVGMLSDFIEARLRRFPTVAVIITTILEYVPVVLSLATAMYIAYLVYPDISQYV